MAWRAPCCYRSRCITGNIGPLRTYIVRITSTVDAHIGALLTTRTTWINRLHVDDAAMTMINEILTLTIAGRPTTVCLLVSRALSVCCEKRNNRH